MAEMAVPGNSQGGRDEATANRMGLIEINDLVYKLEADLSVAINATHKNGFFQNSSYSDTQTSIIILNSGADYIDTRRSFLQLNIQIPQTVVTSVSTNYMYNAFISCFFGPQGSVLNLIDSVICYTRSGDELSRVFDFGQLMYNMIPWVFGEDWARTVGQEIGLGGYLGGYNTNANYTTGVGVSINHRKTFQIPLYLVSPVFTYGRLVPSMLCSGMKIEIKWKPLSVAVQQFWENTPLERPLFNASQDPRYNRFNLTDDLVYLMGNLTGASSAAQTEIGTGGLDALMSHTSNLTIQNGVIAAYFTISQPGGGGGTYWDWTGASGPFPNETQNGYYPSRPPFIPGIDVLSFIDGNQAQYDFPVEAIYHTGQTLIVGNPNQYPLAGGASSNINADGTFNGVGWFRHSRFPHQNNTQRQFGAPIARGREFTGATPLSGYTINEPTLVYKAIQLSDAVQRHLNEYSATNGLEIVYADWDRTSSPYSGISSPIYTEVRRAASRALFVFAVMTDATPSNIFTRNSFASIAGGNFTNYQWQLGALYFPQQRVESKVSTVPKEQVDNMLEITYAYTAEAWDRWHPKAAPTMMSLHGDDFDWSQSGTFSIVIPKETKPDPYLIVPSDYGKYGSFANGALTVATSLERSSMFDLSGIPINNSRVLALRGDFNFGGSSTTGTLYVYLKFVRLARVFLINAEVES